MRKTLILVQTRQDVRVILVVMPGQCDVVVGGQTGHVLLGTLEKLVVKVKEVKEVKVKVKVKRLTGMQP